MTSSITQHDTVTGQPCLTLNSSHSPNNQATLGGAGTRLNSSEAALLTTSSWEVLPWCVMFLLTTTGGSLSSSSSRGMVQVLTMLAERRLAREEPLLAELVLETTERGDMQEVLPLRELRPLSLLL